MDIHLLKKLEEQDKKIYWIQIVDLKDIIGIYKFFHDHDDISVYYSFEIHGKREPSYDEEIYQI